MQAREQAIFSTKAGQPPLFTSPAVCANHLPTPNFRDAAAPAAKGVPLGFRNWFYKKSDRHPDQRNLVSPRELPETLAKISRRYGDYQNPASPGRKPFSQKAYFYGNAKWRLMHSTYIQSFVPLIARALRKDGRPPDYLYSVIIQEDRLVMNQAPNCYF
jgi:hypothetical protein